MGQACIRDKVAADMDRLKTTYPDGRYSDLIADRQRFLDRLAFNSNDDFKVNGHCRIPRELGVDLHEVGALGSVSGMAYLPGGYEHFKKGGCVYWISAPRVYISDDHNISLESFNLVSIYNPQMDDARVEVLAYLDHTQQEDFAAEQDSRLNYARVPETILPVALDVMDILRKHGIDVHEKNLDEAKEKLKALMAKIESRKPSATAYEELGIENAVSLDELLSRR